MPKKKIIPVGVVEPESTIFLSESDVIQGEPEPVKTLEEQLLEIYAAAPSGTRWYARKLAILTNSSIRDINVTWHSLWIDQKVASPELLKP